MSHLDIQANIQLVLGLLRELLPEYYDLEHLHGTVESLDQRARNVHNVIKVIKNKNQKNLKHPATMTSLESRGK